ncbi:uncharacterized protein LOC117210918 [Bombus bifarius]|uniref:Uncharacterized protein LOC117210918 n=1 Tax=Bombus bifarius TaxID=103933 RepID=A0A6P8N614_9HYME|nr:uncharacterized protein LOC117210918 [Bombus bifarius]
MSSIPPVLMLWLLVVSLPLPPAEAGEMMDLFALIRGTLKYWRRIYQMYEEEVALGYCWAEYFLHHEEDATNATIPSSQSIDPSNFLPVENDGFEKEPWNHWGVIAIENRGTRYRSKRSYAIQSSTKKEEILDTSRNSKTMTLGFFVNVGRQLMDYVDSNSVLACTKDYLLGKAIHWIDS